MLGGLFYFHFYWLTTTWTGGTVGRGIELYKSPSEGSEQIHGPGTKKQERLPAPKLVRQQTALYSNVTMTKT